MSAEQRTGFDLANKEKRIKELEGEAARPDFWGIPEKASRISQELADLKSEVSFWRDSAKEIDDLTALLEMAAANEEIKKELEGKISVLDAKIKKEELKTLMAGQYDKNWAVMTIVAGQGGRDAEDFVQMLLRMYTAYFDKQRWSYKVLHQHFSEEPGGSDEAAGERGLKNVSLEIEANYAYGYLKNESGVHRLVRVSPFDAKELRHTSFALVEMMPELKDVDLSDVILDDKDLKIDFYRSSGPGGQNVNKRETAVRVVHLPTGIAVSCQSERSQAQNRDKALHLLKLKLFDYIKGKKTEEKELLHKRVEPSWGNQIRNYVLHPYKLVKDVRTGVETSRINSVLEGGIDDFIQAELALLDKKVPKLKP